ncbi:hypothetical protein [Sphingomonas sp.]|uniref:hypothetical protein n=1 Tax=Sphingomonas sp. TaxID=28214 RepID=UPI000DB80D5F|nr:hypothetical protein [Sphingomonas sp.]PZU09580.1 MAG: hypothetical protein DI605_07845 [Sphingomonas sp.]
MKWLGIFLAAGAIIAAGQAVAVVLGIAILIGLVVALFECPRELFGLIGIGLVGLLMQAQPLAFIFLIALLVVAGMLRKG